MGGRSVLISPMKWTADGLPKAVSFSVLMGAAAFQKNLCVMEKETAWMVQTSSAAVGISEVALLN